MALLCLILILFSLKLYILGGVDVSKLNLENAQKRYQTPTLLHLKQVVQGANTTLGKVDNFYQTETYVSDVLKVVFSVPRPEGVAFSDLNVIREDGGIKVTVLGKSDSRDQLLLFKDNVEKTKGIENSNFPPENLVRPTDIDFNMTIEFHP